MALTPSNMLELGTSAPDFNLPNVDGRMICLSDVAGEKGTMVAFICNHCPYVIHIQDKFVEIARDYMLKGIGFVAINSNDVENYPDDSPEKMKELSEKLKMPFPYLYDETQGIAKAYDAACTPDLYLFDNENKLVYRGQLDGARPGNDVPVTGESLMAAMDALINGEAISDKQIPASGCNIKWKK